MKNTFLRYLFIATLPLYFAGCQADTGQSQPQTLSVLPDTLISYRLRVLQTYLDSTDLSIPDSPDSLFGLFYTLHYGRAPRDLSYLSLTEKLDSTEIRKDVAAFLTPETTDFLAIAQTLEPRAVQYVYLKDHYRRLLRENKVDSLPLIQESMNAYRWIQRFTDSSFALINIPSAELYVNDRNGMEVLRMRVIVGSRSHQTPAFATYTPEIVTYPYWNVPRSIAIQEILPKVKRQVGYLEQNNMQVLDAAGRVLDPSSIAWASLDAAHFPYRFRQSTGCDNALGLVKFNLESPFAIYLHDTNARSLFNRSSRWQSHGCIRLQKPTELANLILDKPVFDEDFLNQCRIGATPGSIRLTTPFPVFILYLLADVDGQGHLRWNANVYQWP